MTVNQLKKLGFTEKAWKKMYQTVDAIMFSQDGVLMVDAEQECYLDSDNDLLYVRYYNANNNLFKSKLNNSSIGTAHDVYCLSDITSVRTKN